MLNRNKMRSLVVLFGLCFVEISQGKVILIDSANPSCLLDGESTVTIQCEITPSSPVAWKKDSVTQTICDNTADDCLPQRNGKNSFTSNVTQNLFFFNIANVSLGTDEGVYVCEDAGVSKSIQLDVCKVPTSVSITESGSGTVTLISTSDCVYPDTNITFDWFYIPVASLSDEKPFSPTQTINTSVSDCTNGAKKISSAFQYREASGNRIEVKFGVKVNHPKLVAPIVNTTSNTYFFVESGDSNDAFPVGAIIGIIIAVVILVIAVIVAIRYKLRVKTMAEGGKRQFLIKKPNNAKLPVKTMAEGGTQQIKRLNNAMRTISGSENIKEEMLLLNAPNAGWEDFLDPSPICICIMSELMAISTTTDFSLKNTQPRNGFKFINWPSSFRSSLVQVVNNGWEAFNAAHTNMDQIRLMSGNVPAELKKTIKILMEGSDEELEQLLPVPLQAIQRTADKCNSLASIVETKFVDLMSLTGEILEASTAAMGHYKNQQRENEIALLVVMENKSMLEKEEEMSEQMYEECKRSVRKAENSYRNALDQMPSGWAMIGMNTVEGISNTFTTALSGASRLHTFGLGKRSEKKSLVKHVGFGKNKSTAAVNEPTLDETSVLAYEKTNQLKSYTEILQAISIERGTFGTNLSAPVSEHIMYVQRQYTKLQNDSETTDKNAVNDTVIGLCKEGVGICIKLMQIDTPMKQDGKKGDKLVDEINNFYQRVLALHVEGTNIMGACPTELKAPKQSVMPLPAGADDITLQQMIQNARFKIEQSSKQLGFMQEKYIRACERLIENNKKVGEVMAEMKELNLKKIEFDKIRQTLITGIRALAQLREQWGKLVRFFQSMSNLIKCCLNESLAGFLEYGSKMQESNLKSLENYPISSLKRDLIYGQAFEAVKIAHLVNMIATSYVEISNNHLIDQIAGLEQIMGYDPEKEWDKINAERNKLNQGCTQAQTAIRDLLNKQKLEFEKRVRSRIQKIKTELGNALPPTPSSDKSTERIQAAVEEGMKEVENAEPELQKGYDYFG